MDESRHIVRVEEVPDDSTLLFTVREGGGDERREAILVRDDDGIEAWMNYCQHFTHIRLDKGSGARLRDDEIVCTNHGAYFDADTGLCTHGPCVDAYLEPITVAVEDGAVYLTDPDYEFVATGPAEDDDLDLSSTSNVEF